MNENTPASRSWGLDALTLKLLAMAFMLCDHLWATVLPVQDWLTMVGRLAYPIFAFQIVEGFHRTHDRKRYMKRMLLFAVLSELPFDLMTDDTLFNPFHQNVMFTFLLAMLLMCWMERVRGSRWKYLLVSAVCLVLGNLLGILTMVDYFGGGVLMVLLFYWTWEKPWGWPVRILGLWYICAEILEGLVLSVTVLGHTVEFYQQSLALLALIPIALYNGRQGYHSRPLQLGCYAFYPVHMLALYLLRQFLLR